ncbi:hypothetical protein C8Q76DRAFT_765012 [Earliella scabrosa]|nr:hypothetical protein C8Q76DRAFT_765012 [Earliella scabrosa]
MSVTSSTVKATIAIFGATGDIGFPASRVFLEEFPASFPTVRVVTRDPAAPKAQELAKKGAELHSIDEPLDNLLTGVDVVVNCLPTAISDEYKTELTNASIRNGVKVFFLSEYGIDYNLNDFPIYEHKEWTRKRKWATETRALMKGTNIKVIALVTGTFLEMALEPYHGVDIKHNRYIALGDPKNRFAVTSEYDIGRALARLSILALDPATSASVPEDVRIAGQNLNYEDIRDAVARVKGVPKGEIVSEDLAAHKKMLQETKDKVIFEFVRVLTGEGKVDYSQGNANELVNPNQALWKWKTIDDQLREM